MSESKKEVLSEDEMDNINGGADGGIHKVVGRPGAIHSTNEHITHTNNPAPSAPVPQSPSFTVTKTQSTTGAPTRNPGGQVVGDSRGFTPRDPNKH